jgi:hypothetical protein
VRPGLLGYDDHGLGKAMAGEPTVTQLASVAGVLDATGAKVNLPQAPEPRPTVPGMPLPPLPIPLPMPGGVPVPLSLAALPMGAVPPDPGIPPRAPLPPEPWVPQLPTAQQQAFRQWMDGLPKYGFAGGNAAAKDYQRYTAGYPEYGLPLPPGNLKPSGQIQADGLRPADGAIIDAKYVSRIGCSPRDLNNLDNQVRNGKEFLLNVSKGDFNELNEYNLAIQNSGGAAKKVEIITNDPASAIYWEYMLGLTKTPGEARYIPAP